MNYLDFVKIAFISKEEFTVPVWLLKPFLNTWFLPIVGLVFFGSSIIVLAQTVPSRIWRFLIFISCTLLVAATGSFGLINHAQDGLLCILLFLSLLPDNEFKIPENVNFNQAVLYGARLMMLFYTVSGLHKLYYFTVCLFSKGCMEHTAYLDHHIFSNVFLRRLHIPVDFIFQGMTQAQGNFLFLCVSLLEFLAFFSTYSRRWLRVMLFLFIILHFNTMLFMRIHFLPFIYVHTLLLVFFLRDEGRSEAVN